MNAFVVILAGVVAVAAAVRSTWSPCGQSMLSTITPMAEHTRRHHFWATAAWFVVGSTAGGMTLGGVVAVGALVCAAVGLSSFGAAAIASVLAAVAAASDSRTFGVRLPYHCRQVNELWLNRYRPWVYGVGFGWQIGVGIATFVMTAGIYLMIALAALTASPIAAFGIGVLFGIVRGLAVIPARRITTPESLRAFHRRFDALEPVTRRGMIGVQLAVSAAAASVAWAIAAGVIVVIVVGVAAVMAVTAVTERSSSSLPPEVMHQ